MNATFALPAHLSTSIQRQEIDIKTGEERALQEAFTPAKSWSELKFALLNVESQSDLAEFLNDSGTVPMGETRWEPQYITPAVLKKWISYRDALRECCVPPWIGETPLRRQVENLIDFDCLSLSPEITREGRLGVRITVDSVTTAITLVGYEDALAGLGVCRCRACHRFFERPSGYCRDLNYCPGKKRLDGSYRPSKCYERARKQRRHARQRQQYLQWARQAESKWKRLSKKARTGLRASDFIAKEAGKISGGKFPYRSNWVTTNVLRRKA